MKKTTFYKIECITNLHVGSGDINYNIVDNEVERNAVTQYPIIHASGVKGALRDAVSDKDYANAVFGKQGAGEECNTGSHKFLDAQFIARTMRLAGDSNKSCILVTTVGAINDFLAMLSAFGENKYGFEKIEDIDFGDCEFLTNSSKNISVEDEKTGKLDSAVAEKIGKIIGGDFAVAKSINNYPLPVVARNHLENGISKNLWYEEVVPHGSIFYFAIICDDDAQDYMPPELIQFGGHASIGCGFCKISKF